MTKKKLQPGSHLRQTQKRRQWEFLTLRKRWDDVTKLLGLEEFMEPQQVAELKQELANLERRGKEIYDTQIKFLRVKHKKI